MRLCHGVIGWMLVIRVSTMLLYVSYRKYKQHLSYMYMYSMIYTKEPGYLNPKPSLISRLESKSNSDPANAHLE